GSDSWNWWPHGSHSPDVVATDDRDELALVLEAKSPRASLQATSARKVRAAIAATDARLARDGRKRDARSVEISQRRVPRAGGAPGSKSVTRTGVMVSSARVGHRARLLRPLARGCRRGVPRASRCREQLVGSRPDAVDRESSQHCRHALFPG